MIENIINAELVPDVLLNYNDLISQLEQLEIDLSLQQVNTLHNAKKYSEIITYIEEKKKEIYDYEKLHPQVLL